MCWVKSDRSSVCNFLTFCSGELEWHHLISFVGTRLLAGMRFNSSGQTLRFWRIAVRLVLVSNHITDSTVATNLYYSTEYRFLCGKKIVVAENMHLLKKKVYKHEEGCFFLCLSGCLSSINHRKNKPTWFSLKALKTFLTDSALCGSLGFWFGSSFSWWTHTVLWKSKPSCHTMRFHNGTFLHKETTMGRFPVSLLSWKHKWLCRDRGGLR